eukprot:3482131-Lingulodinium_polyedra.AAC.1
MWRSKPKAEGRVAGANGRPTGQRPTGAWPQPPVAPPRVSLIRLARGAVVEGLSEPSLACWHCFGAES